jgi:hypothetical protein
VAADARWIHVIAWPNAMARRACRRRPYHHGVLMHALTLHLVLIAVLGSAQRLAAPAQYFREPWRDSAHAQLRVGGDIMQQPNGRLDFAPQPAAVRRRPPGRPRRGARRPRGPACCGHWQRHVRTADSTGHRLALSGGGFE